MNLSKKLEKALNDQINKEHWASYSYLGMAAYLETTAFKGFAAWMLQQSNEETTHARKIIDYVQDRNGTITLPPIATAKTTYPSLHKVFEQSLKQEQDVTASIKNIYDLALKEKDFQTMEFLDWFLKEQVEEEKDVQDILDRLKLAGDNPDALLLLDKEAAKRK